MTRYLEHTVSIIDRVNHLVGLVVAWLTLAMVIVTCAVVLARYLLNYGSIGLQESVTYMHGMVFMLCIAFTLKERGHVRVDVLHEKLPPATRHVIDIAGHLLFLLPFSIFILWTSYDYVAFSWSLRESSGQPGGLPGVYLLKALIPAMAVLLFLQGVAEVIRSALEFRNDDGVSR